MFTDKFPSYVCQGTAIHCEVEGFKCTATVYRDDDSDAPWVDDCGHGPVSEWTTRDKKPGELVLCESRNSKRYYDFAKACKTARLDGWRAWPEHSDDTPRKVAAEAAMADFKMLKAWCNDEWFYCGVAVTVEFNGVKLTGKYDHALWRVEANFPDSDNDYLREIANEYLPAALAAAKARAKELRAQLASVAPDNG